MNRKRIKTILIVLIFCIAMIASVGYYLFNKGPADIKNNVAIKTEASALYLQFISDSTGAIKNYSGKVIEVTGEVNSISMNQQNEKIILLKTNTDGAYVNCTMEEDPGNIKIKDRVVFKGICSGIGEGDEDLGLTGDVYVTRCFIIKK